MPLKLLVASRSVPLPAAVCSGRSPGQYHRRQRACRRHRAAPPNAPASAPENESLDAESHPVPYRGHAEQPPPMRVSLPPPPRRSAVAPLVAWHQPQPRWCCLLFAGGGSGAGALGGSLPHAAARRAQKPAQVRIGSFRRTSALVAPHIACRPSPGSGCLKSCISTVMWIVSMQVHKGGAPNQCAAR